MADLYEYPENVYDYSTEEEGFITIAVCQGDDYGQKACVTWMDDYPTANNFRVSARVVKFREPTDIQYENKYTISAGYTNDNINGIYGPIVGIRYKKTAHVGWTDWDSGNTDYGIHADWNHI